MSKVLCSRKKNVFCIFAVSLTSFSCPVWMQYSDRKKKKQWFQLFNCAHKVSTNEPVNVFNVSFNLKFTNNFFQSNGERNGFISSWMMTRQNVSLRMNLKKMKLLQYSIYIINNNNGSFCYSIHENASTICSLTNYMYLLFVWMNCRNSGFVCIDACVPRFKHELKMN